MILSVNSAKHLLSCTKTAVKRLGAVPTTVAQIAGTLLIALWHTGTGKQLSLGAAQTWLGPYNIITVLQKAIVHPAQHQYECIIIKLMWGRGEGGGGGGTLTWDKEHRQSKVLIKW